MYWFAKSIGTNAYAEQIELVESLEALLQSVISLHSHHLTAEAGRTDEDAHFADLVDAEHVVDAQSLARVHCDEAVVRVHGAGQTSVTDSVTPTLL